MAVADDAGANLRNRERAQARMRNHNRARRRKKGAHWRCQPRMLTATDMPVLALIDAVPLLPARGALIGLDLGTKTIGVASSDPDRRVAAPVETIARKRFNLDVRRLLDLAAERHAVGLVLGLPINMDGTEGPRAQATRAFARNLAKLTELPIALWDERLSTAAVERALIDADASRLKRKAVIDQHAAAYILQGALDRLAKASRATQSDHRAD
jgi:putative holliday junction resolvase